MAQGHIGIRRLTTRSHKPQVSCPLVSNYSEATPPDVAGARRPEGQTGCLRASPGLGGLGFGICLPAPPLLGRPAVICLSPEPHQVLARGILRPKTGASVSTAVSVVLKSGPLLPLLLGSPTGEVFSPLISPGSRFRVRGWGGEGKRNDLPYHRA